MHKRLKSIILAAVLAVSLPIAGYSGAVQASASQVNPIALFVDDTLLEGLDAPPIIFNDYAFVPARSVFERMGAEVTWIPPTQEIIVSLESVTVVMQIGSNFAIVSGELVGMTTPPQLINGHTMIPLRFVSQALGFEVNWDGARREVNVWTTRQKNNVSPPVNEPAADTPQDSNDHLGNDNVPPPSAEDTTPRNISATAIPAQQHPETRLTSVNASVLGTTPGTISYGITAAGPISRVDKLFLYGNRVILDIHNAGSSLPTVTPIASSRFVRQVRTNTVDSTYANATRVVFDLHAPFDVSVTVSEDRRTVNLNFTQISVTDIRMTTDGTTDTVIIDLNGVPRPSTSFNRTTQTFTVDLPGAYVGTAVNRAEQGRHVSHILSSQPEPTAGQVAFTVRGETSVQKEVVGNSIVITFAEPTYRNISYNSATRTLSIAGGGLPINTASVVRNNEYLARRYTMGLGQNLSTHLGFGSFYIGDEFLDSVTIQTDAQGQTHLVFATNRVLAFTITEDHQYIHIRARLPREVYSHIVVVDPGHGGSDSGAPHGGFYEKDLVLQKALKLIANIRRTDDIKVYTTRYTDVDVSLRQRVNLANEIGADLFISIHNNASDRNPNANGTETYYSARPNANPNSINSRAAAEIFQRNILSAINFNDREVRQSRFYVIHYTTMPAVFLEVGFMSNAAELQRLADPAVQQRAADGIYAAIREVFSVYTPQR